MSSSPSPRLEFLNAHPFVRATVQDKIFGAIFGSALGDCIGLYTEFLPRAAALRAYPEQKFSLLKPTEFRNDSHRNKFEPSSWTDDTDHALLMLLSYIHNKGQILPEDFAARLQSWCRQGLRALDRLPLGLGQTVGRVALDPEYLNNPVEVARTIWLKSGRRSAANGSLMRTHPLGIMCLPYSLEETFRHAAEMSRMTHAHPRCVLSCCIATALLRGILRGEVVQESDIDDIIEKARKWLDEDEQSEFKDPAQGKEMTETDSPDFLDEAEFEKMVKAEKFEELQLDDSQKLGYVYKCLGASVLALRLAMRRKPLVTSSPSQDTGGIFEDIITELIMYGGDADTNACAAGALVGAWLGYGQLPDDWRKGIESSEWLWRKTDALSRLVGVSEEPFVEDADTALDGGRGLLSQEEMDQRDRDFVFKVLSKSQARRQAEKEAELKAKKKKPLFGQLFGGGTK